MEPIIKIARKDSKTLNNLFLVVISISQKAKYPTIKIAHSSNFGNILTNSHANSLNERFNFYKVLNNVFSWNGI